jgi:hypothetical protein
MTTIKAQRVPKKQVKPDEILYRFCLLFPQYTYKQATRLPAKRVMGMLKVAQEERAKDMLDILQIVAAPHTKKGSAVKKLYAHYKALID